MDPLSISASIAGLIALVQSILGYLSDANDLSKALEEELKGLDGVMRSLQSVSEILQSRTEDSSGETD